MLPVRHRLLLEPFEETSGGSSHSGEHGSAQEWRVGHRGRDQMFYEECEKGLWRRIEIDGEMLTGPAHHVIYFASPDQWQKYPEWAKGRREEIVSRIKSEFRPPDYEYFENGYAPAPKPSNPARKGAPFLMILFLLAIAAYMGWTTKKAMDVGSVSFRGKYGVNFEFSRVEDPFGYWLTTSFLSAIGVGAGAYGLWLVASSFRPR